MEIFQEDKNRRNRDSARNIEKESNEEDYMEENEEAEG